MGKRKQTPITKSAKGEVCLVRVPGVCNFDPKTTVYAHLNGGGTAMKHSDLHGAYACFNCHSWLDGGYVKTHSRNERDLVHLEAIVRTQTVLIKKDLVKIEGN